MPYKDIDYEKLAENNEIHRKLYRKVAITNAINEGKIDKAEYLSNKQLIPTSSLLETYKIQQLQEPIIKAIENIPTPQIVLPPPPEPQAIEPPPKEKRILHDPDHGLNLSIIESEGLPKLYTILEKVLEETVDLDDLIKRASKRKALANSRKNRANRRGNTTQFSEEKQKEETLKTYINRLRHLQKLIPSIQYGDGCDNYTMDKLAVLLGELKAGNTSPDIKTDIKEMAHYFYKNGELTMQQYKAILSNV